MLIKKHTLKRQNKRVPYVNQLEYKNKLEFKEKFKIFFYCLFLLKIKSKICLTYKQSQLKQLVNNHWNKTKPVWKKTTREFWNSAYNSECMSLSNFGDTKQTFPI